MEIEFDFVRDAAVLRPIGALTAEDGVRILKEEVQRLLDEGHRRLVLNLAGATVIDADGLGALVLAMVQASRAGGALRLVLPEQFHPTVQYQWSAFATFRSEKDAVASFATCEATVPAPGLKRKAATLPHRDDEIVNAARPSLAMKGPIKRQLALEQAQRYRGPATRLVAPITSVAEANLVIRECSLALIVLGVIQILFTLRLGQGSIGIGVFVVMAALFLRLRPGVPAAVILSAICLTILLMQIWATAAGARVSVLLPMVLAVFVARAVWAARMLKNLRSNAVNRTDGHPLTRDSGSGGINDAEGDVRQH